MGNGDGGWVTVQLRVRAREHEYLKRQAEQAGLSIALTAGSLIRHASRIGWEVLAPEVMEPLTLRAGREHDDGLHRDRPGDPS